MKFDQLIGGDASPRPLYKKSKLNISLNQQYEILWSFFFILCTSRGLPKLLKLRCWALAFTLYEAFSKNKNRSETSLPTLFSAWILKKDISQSIFS